MLPTWPTPSGFTLQRIKNRKKILVVDRDESLLYFCGYLVLQSEMSVYLAEDPGQAFIVLSEVPVDLVVTELESTTLTGVDLTHHVRTNYPHVPVIVMTPFGEVSGPVMAVKGGATDYLVKPFSGEEFRQKLKAWSLGQGAFRKWARSEDGLPEERALRSNAEIFAQARENRGAHESVEENIVARRPSVHQRKLADAARTLRQLIRRDVEETALFSAVAEDELRAAALASASEQESNLLCLANPDAHERSDQDDL